jgi:hypothetical protein
MLESHSFTIPPEVATEGPPRIVICTKCNSGVDIQGPQDPDYIYLSVIRVLGPLDVNPGVTFSANDYPGRALCCHLLHTVLIQHRKNPSSCIMTYPYLESHSFTIPPEVGYVVTL